MTSSLSLFLLVVSIVFISTSNSFEFTKQILSFGPRSSYGRETGLKQTRDYIISTLKKYNFTIELETHKENTPLGVVEFTNIIANYKQQLNKKKLILAAHYESKFYKDLNFVGATDAAFPCGLLLELSSFIDQQIQSRNWNDPSVDFQLVFFDGEEAFVGFSEKDGLYGSKYIASKWEKQVIQFQN
jgi:glutaminyl-peptide cyclotransferase